MDLPNSVDQQIDDTERKERPSGSIPKKFFVGPMTVFIGATENSRRPEAVWMKCSLWVSPELSISKSMQKDNTKIDTLVADIGYDFNEFLIHNLHKNIKKLVNQKYFNQRSFIYVPTKFAYEQMELGKYTWCEFEISLDTVNEMDYDTEEVLPHTDGITYNYGWSDFQPILQEFAKNIMIYLSERTNDLGVKFSKTRT